MSKGQSESEASPLNFTQDSAALDFVAEVNGQSAHNGQTSRSLESPKAPASAFRLEKDALSTGAGLEVHHVLEHNTPLFKVWQESAIS